jgi:pimeloyl-ACP methyl ester carboxylesterase
LALVLCVAEIPAAQGAGPKARRVEFGTPDGVRIVSDYYPAKVSRSAPAIILLHMYGENRSSWVPLIEPLHEAGFAILAMDLRGHGESIEPTSENLAEQVARRDAKLFRHMYEDVMGAYTWLWKQSGIDMSRIGLVGASVGCSVSIDYAGRDQSVDVLVCMTPGRRYLGIDSNKGMAKIGPRRGLFLASEAERGDAEYLASQGKQVEAKILPQGSFESDGLHGTKMFGNVAGVEKM